MRSENPRRSPVEFSGLGACGGNSPIRSRRRQATVDSRFAVAESRAPGASAHTGQGASKGHWQVRSCFGPAALSVIAISPDGAGGQRGDDEYPSAEGHPELMMILI